MTKTMALFSSPTSPLVALRPRCHLRNPNPNPNSINSSSYLPILRRRGQPFRFGVAAAASNLCEQETLTLDARSLKVKEYFTEAELLAAVRLRIRTFYEFDEATYNIEDHKRHLTEREYEALKDRVGGMRIGFKRVTCINATLPLSPSLVSAHELCSACKFLEDGENRVVVGTLDLNQCLSLADELTGKKPQGTGPDLKRAYLSNVCVAKELQRNGLGYALISKSKEVAREWGDYLYLGLLIIFISTVLLSVDITGNCKQNELVGLSRSFKGNSKLWLHDTVQHAEDLCLHEFFLFLHVKDC